MTEISVTPRRWLVLLVFAFFSFTNAVAWIQYTIIPHIFIEYYQTSEMFISWTALSFSSNMVLFMVPCLLFLETTTLRRFVLVGSFINLLGNVIKCCAVQPDLWWLSFTGQFIVACTMPFLLEVPARIASVWFPQNQVSTATSIGVFGNQLGVAVGFVLPPAFVPGPPEEYWPNGVVPEDWSNTTKYSDAAEKTVEDVGKQILLMFVVGTGLCAISFLSILVFFRNEPDRPPSEAEALRRAENITKNHGSKDALKVYKKALSDLLKNRSYIFLMISYGINGGSYYAISTLLPQLLGPSFEDSSLSTSEKDTLFGWMGLCFIVAGLVGSILGGLALDASKKFKLVTMITYIGVLGTFAAFAGILDLSRNCAFSTEFFFCEIFEKQLNSIPTDYILISILGFFMTGYLPIGFEYAAELTYPIDECTSSGMLNFFIGIFSMGLTIGCQENVQSLLRVKAFA
ncbi:Oidioi.mRNA.OKI2018_I69.chr1.g760.t1.cds [Oikopleura dioica]|uniref:Oidioi.mRNA.OKI2018_I69.chr1.g760.t1.cds n=1 Tax=Oikopleura dioica TaxID=34765 RepID=A0ABN7SPH6_OIKDI|nr:Oidioi.mRNA.OKI2018_I69.chr1.g760.t1.cds [Oikopleura dioica]